MLKKQQVKKIKIKVPGVPRECVASGSRSCLVPRVRRERKRGNGREREGKRKREREGRGKIIYMYANT
jgi:hypothetical protein